MIEIGVKMSRNIVIKGAKVNNLKNIDVTIPRDKLVVLSGLSLEFEKGSLRCKYF